ncbi:hypothetical protein [Rhizobium straminoryzae]|uniref:Uncharacterized protein n=1 Tax=Rhizobium straminoryzae TaxID=1387186 RepID=A0A549TD42_9HYPH|nr:hypothetical protein [Rhizobium straminoryzae]TRL39846.1 hypothetical protein FNA46_07885 [Rhizobium straminoryzae]
MSNALVEEIEQLHNCRTHQECAEWLLTCPLSKLLTYEFAIRSRLRTRGFLLGIEHLDHVLFTMRAPQQNGYPVRTTEALNVLATLRAIAAHLPGTDEIDA